VRSAVLEHNAAWRLLEPAWGRAKLEEPIALDRDQHLTAQLFPVPGKVPTYLQELEANHAEATVGVRVTDVASGQRLVYVPGLRSLDAGTWAELEAAACAFVDGTFYTSDELARSRPGAPDAHAMGHLPISGPEGSLERLAKLPGRILYIHINNTNPVLRPNSAEAEQVASAGLEIAWDGQEFEV
jgi:pyrroloquinoline quinone biosynthesis protein B